MRSWMTAALISVLATGTALTQQAASKKPEKPAHVARFEFSAYAGMCVGYCSSKLEVEYGVATLTESSWSDDKQRCPDLKVRADLSGKHWKELTDLVDRDKLFALPDSIGCPGCVDEPVESVNVYFSDHEKKGIGYNIGTAPQQIKALVEKLSALEQRLYKEISPMAMARCR